ncbi:MAG: hypothetical protein GAK38_02915 [Xylophilus sp.]|nr:MAG: hypothetical protein GAK38_02915 [Xylophilus sp.]
MRVTAAIVFVLCGHMTAAFWLLLWKAVDP